MKRLKNNILLTAFIFICFIMTAIIAGLCLPAPEDNIQGQAETTDYRISGKIAGRVREFRVKRGDRVRAGDTLVIMDSPELYAKMQQAQSAREAALSMEEKALNGSRSEQIQAALSRLQQAEAKLSIAQKTYERISSLRADGVVSEQKCDEALAQLQSAQAATNAAHAQWELAVNGERKENKQASHAQVNKASAAIEEMEAYLRETVFVSPTDGVVAEIFPEVDELVGAGAPIMNVDDETDVWFTFNVREDQLANFLVGKEATVYMPALRKDIPVRIALTKNVGNFATWKATKSLDQYDLKMFEVRAYPTTDEVPHGIRTGMSAILRRH